MPPSTYYLEYGHCVQREVLHAVDREKGDAQVSFSMHACGSVPMVMVLRLLAQGPSVLRYYNLLEIFLTSKGEGRQNLSPNGFQSS